MNSTIAEDLTRLQSAKTDIANAIIAKGVTLSPEDGFEDFSSAIANIPTGSSISVEPLEITENGIYTAPENKAYSPVSVAIAKDIPYITDGLCLYFGEDIGRYRFGEDQQLKLQHDISKINSRSESMKNVNTSTFEFRFTMPQYIDKARLCEAYFNATGDGNSHGIAFNMNGRTLEVLPPDGTWIEDLRSEYTFESYNTYTLSIVFNMGNMDIYVNGEFLVSRTYVSTDLNSVITNFCFGGAYGMDGRWWPYDAETYSNGISKMRIYNRCLSAAEITTNYQTDLNLES